MKRAFAEPLENRLLLAITAPVLDRSFHGYGQISEAFNGGYNNANAIAVQADGKIIVAGNAKLSNTSQTYGFAAIRYNADGSLDDGSPTDSTPGDSFGVGGVYQLGRGVASSITSIAIQKDGKILLAGSESSAVPIAQQTWLIIRLNRDGTIDKTYGSGGTGGEAFSIDNTPLTSIALQSDGKLVVVGTENNDWLIGRFTTAGILDDTFGDTGAIRTDFGGTDSASGVAIDGLGKIVVTGNVQGVTSNLTLLTKLGVARYLPNGTLDKSFGVGGKVFYSDNVGRHREIGGVAIRPNGNILVSHNSVGDVTSSAQIGFVTEFDDTGLQVRNFGLPGFKFAAIAILPNGQYVYDANEPHVYDDENFRYKDVAGVGIEGLGAFPVSQVIAGTNTAIAVDSNGHIYTAGFVNNGIGTIFETSKYIGVSPSTYGTIRGNIYSDADSDHVKDSNEKGIGHVRVYIDSNNDGKFDQIAGTADNEVYTFTDINGNYLLTDLPAGIYKIREVVPAKNSQELPASKSISATVRLGAATTAINFVNHPIAVASTATAITGSVFNDFNGNGTRQVTGAAEPDLANIVVFLDKNKNGKRDAGETQTKTDVSGNYAINISKAGTYRVAELVPKGWTNTTPKQFDVTIKSHQQIAKLFGQQLIDTNDTINEIKSATLLKAGKPVGGTIATATDVNFYAFNVPAGTELSIDIDRLAGSSLNSYLRLFDTAGHQLAANDNGAGDGETLGPDSFIDFTFAKSGTYIIAVSDNLNKIYNPLTGKSDLGGGTVGKYTLSVAIA